MIRDLLLTAAGEAENPAPNVADVFSVDLYTGNGTSLAISNGVNLAEHGGLVWIKSRAYGDNILIDSTSGTGKYLVTNSANGQATNSTIVTSFNANGFTLGGSVLANQVYASYVAWTFRKAPRFFDIVVYTGDGAANRLIPHNLCEQIGLMTIKRISGISDWGVCSIASAGDYYTIYQSNSLGTGSGLNTSAIATQFRTLANLTKSYFEVGRAIMGDTNEAGALYVAYLFAHDVTSSGIIRSGLPLTDNNGYTNQQLGWAPQFVLYKGHYINNWKIVDGARGWESSNFLFSNSNVPEQFDGTKITPNPLGFELTSGGNRRYYLYLSIRQENT